MEATLPKHQFYAKLLDECLALGGSLDFYEYLAINKISYIDHSNGTIVFRSEEDRFKFLFKRGLLS